LVHPAKSAPWYVSVRDALRKAKRDRRSAEYVWRRSKLTVHKQIFAAAKCAVASLVHNAKSVFLCDQISDCDSSKKLFNICGRLTGRTKVSPLPTIFPSVQLPQVFCDYFIQKVADIHSGLDSVVCPSATTDSNCDTVFMSFHPVSEDEVKRIVLRSKPTTCSFDPIPTNLLFECINTVLPSLTRIINDSLSSGIFPSSFKTAVIKPLLILDT
jgi:hypothetical protein